MHRFNLAVLQEQAMTLFARATLLAAVGVLLGTSRSPAQTFFPLDTFPNSSPNASEARGLTADGTIAVGLSGNRAFVWSQPTGLLGLSGAVGSGAQAYAIERMGSYAVGVSTGTAAGSSATLWYPGGVASLYNPS